MSDVPEFVDLSSEDPSKPDAVQESQKFDFSARRSKVDVAGLSKEEAMLKYIESLRSGDAFPWEPVLLPSRGLFYDGWKSGIVQVRPLTQKAEEILATQRLQSTGQSIDYLFREYVRFETAFDPLDLTSEDR
jgi:hypothetical protein